MGLAHFAGHADESFPFRGAQLTGKQLPTWCTREMYGRLMGERAPTI